MAIHVLDHRQRRVAEDVGKHHGIHATVERQGRVGVAQQVRIDALGDACAHAQVLDDLFDAGRRQCSVIATRAAAEADEDAIRWHVPWPAALSVAEQASVEAWNWHHPLSRLAPNAYIVGPVTLDEV